jgi:hypothetical protein
MEVLFTDFPSTDSVLMLVREGVAPRLFFNGLLAMLDLFIGEEAAPLVIENSSNALILSIPIVPLLEAFLSFVLVVVG